MLVMALVWPIQPHKINQTGRRLLRKVHKTNKIMERPGWLHKVNKVKRWWGWWLEKVPKVNRTR